MDHPDRNATATCVRCGRFICGACDSYLGLVGSGRCGPCRQRDQAGAYGKIGGWLWLPAIGLGLEMLGLVALLAAVLFGFVSLGTDFLSAAERPFFQSERLVLALAVLALVFDVFVAFRFFRRKRSAPAWMMLSYVLGLGIAIVQWVDDDLQVSLGSAALNIMRPLAWIAYFATSERVKRTFVVD